jgi:hypothetical protein
VLAQKDDDGTLRLVRCASRSLSPAESLYPSYSREVLALVYACTKWASLLSAKPFCVYTDCEAMTALPISPKTRAVSTRWLVFLSSFSFRCVHIRGVDNHLADLLSRHPELAATAHDDPNEQHLLFHNRIFAEPLTDALRDSDDLVRKHEARRKSEYEALPGVAITDLVSDWAERNQVSHEMIRTNARRTAEELWKPVGQDSLSGRIPPILWNPSTSTLREEKRNASSPRAPTASASMIRSVPSCASTFTASGPVIDTV